MQVKSSVKMNFPRIKQLTQAAVTALEITAEALHTEVVQAQVMPFDSGHLEEDASFVDYSESKHGRARLVPVPHMHGGYTTTRNMTSRRTRTRSPTGNGMGRGAERRKAGRLCEKRI